MTAPIECQTCGAHIPMRHSTKITLPSDGRELQVCSDVGSCVARVASGIYGRKYTEVQQFIAELSIRHNAYVGKCLKCTADVAQLSDYVAVRANNRPGYYHYSCFVGLISERVRGITHD